jgi:pimeloyl-ACP methyl ester carboxylesterase
MKKALIIITCSILVLCILAVSGYFSFRPAFVNGVHQLYRTAAGEKRMMELYAETLSRWKVPYREIDLNTSWGRTHVITAGPENKKPLVLLQGAGANASVWLFQISELSRDHRVYALDTIGDIGKSRATRLPGNPRDYADWLNGVFSALRLERASVVGVSYGGYIAHWFLHYYPGRVDRMALFSFTPMKDGVPVTTMLRMIYYTLVQSDEKIHASIRWYNNGPLKDQFMENKIAESFSAMNKHCRPHILAPALLPEKALKAIKAPLLVIVGEKDVVYDAAKGREYCMNANPAIRFEVIPGAGHLLVPDRTEIVDRLILDFLK